MTYNNLMAKLCSIPKIACVKEYRCNNFITPNVIGFIPLVYDYRAEISYGTGIDGSYIVGFTLFDGNTLVPYNRRELYDKCFMEDEIESISAHAQRVALALEKAR